MTAYLRSHPPARSQFRSPRRALVSGVIAIHTAENTPDFVAFDGGAEAVANFIQNRDTPGSYHDLVDSDSPIHLVDWADEAYHDGTGTNPHSLSVSIATRADVWPWAPQAWRDGAIDQAAQAAARQARWVKATTGIVVPAQRISAAQARNREPGFVAHAQLDPTRRTDPGEHFPWQQFLTLFATYAGHTPEPPEDDDMGDYATRIILAYEEKGRDPHSRKEADDVDGWIKQLRVNPNGPEFVVQECRRQLGLKPTKDH